MYTYIHIYIYIHIHICIIPIYFRTLSEFRVLRGGRPPRANTPQALSTLTDTAITIDALKVYYFTHRKLVPNCDYSTSPRIVYTSRCVRVILAQGPC